MSTSLHATEATVTPQELASRSSGTLATNVVRATSWLLVATGIIVWLTMVADPNIPPWRANFNLLTSVIGAGCVLLLGRGHVQQASQILVWGCWLLITISAWRTGGLRAPTLLNYPVAIVLSGWLLGKRHTQAMFAATWTFLLIAYVGAEYFGWFPTAGGISLLSQLSATGISVLIVTTLTLLARSSYLDQISIISKTASELAAREVELRKLSMAVEQSPDSILITDLKPHIEYVNQAFETVTGYTREEILGRNPNMLQSGKTAPDVYEDLWRALKSGKSWRGELINRRKNGEEFVEHAIISPIRQADGTVTHYMGVKHDLTEIRRAQAEIRSLTYFDPLTGLPNRAYLIDELQAALGDTGCEEHSCALLLINVDRFKTINDGHGRAVADALLAALAHRLRTVVRPEDTLARLAGDEFAMLLRYRQPYGDPAGRRTLAVIEKIQQSLKDPFLGGDGHRLAVTVSVGVAHAARDMEPSANELLRRADTALHKAKNGGPASVVFFDANMGESAQQQARLEQELRHAIASHELRLFIQSQVTHDRRVVGAEALVRWQHPVRGLVGPVEFIGLAEESGLIEALEAWVMSQALELIVRCEQAGRPLQLSVNVSPRHFQRPSFAGWMQSLLEQSGALPERLTIEMTESVAMHNFDAVVEKMTQLSDLGIHFSVDDFGTGYSSLAYLKRLPIHELKIDKTFVQDAPHDAGDAALVETILSVARHLKLRVVAEGVETEEHAHFLNERDASIVHQGYLYAKPQPVQSWLAQWLN